MLENYWQVVVATVAAVVVFYSVRKIMFLLIDRVSPPTIPAEFEEHIEAVNSLSLEHAMERVDAVIRKNELMHASKSSKVLTYELPPAAKEFFSRYNNVEDDETFRIGFDYFHGTKLPGLIEIGGCEDCGYYLRQGSEEIFDGPSGHVIANSVYHLVLINVAMAELDKISEQ